MEPIEVLEKGRIDFRIGARTELDQQFRAIFLGRIKPGEKVGSFIKRVVVEWGGGLTAPPQGADLVEQIRRMETRLRELEEQLRNVRAVPVSLVPAEKIPGGDAEAEAKRRVNALINSM